MSTTEELRERLKYKDYVKHINWVFHKTQVPPKIILIGKNSESVPLRRYNLRICEIARLDASVTAPSKSELFDDLRQRAMFEDITDDAIVTNPKIAKKYLNKTNVVILDDDNIVIDPKNLVLAILGSEVFLTNHGRFLFDVPQSPSLHVSSSTGTTSYITEVIRTVNTTLQSRQSDSRFIIEEIKLSVEPDSYDIVDSRVYLKKERR